MERKLAHIEKIIDIQPIPGADNILKCTVLGWHCVISKKDKFKIGNKIIYVEVDSIMPNKPEYQFLKNYKFRVKTIKLRKQISQGLILPIPDNWKIDSNKKFTIGEDVTKKLGIIKYISPAEKSELLNQKIKHHWTKKYQITKWLWKYTWFRNFITPIRNKNWPNWVSKTDEDRIQNNPEFLILFADKIVEVTEKIDYQSATFTIKRTPWFKKNIFCVCSRNLRSNNKNSLYWAMAKKYNLKKLFNTIMLTQYWNHFTIQGEQGGPGVQSNRYQLPSSQLFIFNLFRGNNIESYEDMKNFCNYQRLHIVPFIKKCKLSELGNTVDDLIKFSEGRSKINPDIQREGIVVRCIEDRKKMFSFKVVNPKYLLKYE